MLIGEVGLGLGLGLCGCFGFGRVVVDLMFRSECSRNVLRCHYLLMELSASCHLMLSWAVDLVV